MSEFKIPVDDIAEVYTEASPEAKRAVTNILTCSDNFACATYAGTAPNGMNMVNVDWSGSSGNMYLFLVFTLVQMGRQQFGEVWLNELAKNLTSRPE